MTFGAMETEYRAKRAAGRKMLVPYITGGLAGWQDAVRAAAPAAAAARTASCQPARPPAMYGTSRFRPAARLARTPASTAPTGIP